MSQLENIKGLGPAKAVELKTALELGRRLIVSTPVARPAIKSPADAANLLLDMATLQQEEMRALFLDTQNRVISIHTVYAGSLNTTVIRVAELFKEAERQNC